MQLGIHLLPCMEDDDEYEEEKFGRMRKKRPQVWI